MGQRDIRMAEDGGEDVPLDVVRAHHRHSENVSQRLGRGDADDE